MSPAGYKRGRVYVSRNPKAQGLKLRYVLYKPPARVRTNNPMRWSECDYWKVYVQLDRFELCVAAWNAVKVDEGTVRKRFHRLLGCAKV